MNDKNTILTTYGEARQIMEYMDGYCGCCRDRMYSEWYENNEAYFVRKGIFVIDELMYVDCLNDTKDDLKPVRYCFSFDFSEKEYSTFTMLNYYNREKVCSFKFIRAESPEFYNIKPKIEFYDLKAFDRLGNFMNPIIREKLNKSWDSFINRNGALPKAKYDEAYKKQMALENKMLLEFMCEHTVEMAYSIMYYYTKEKPQEIEYSSFFKQEDLEYITKKQKYQYKYTGYINLNDTKIYRTKINPKVFEEKGKYERHIESWTVRGHYRTIKGKKVWINDHIRGEGRLEERIYGTKPESEVLLMPKVFECERTVVVAKDRISELPKKIEYQKDLGQAEKPVQVRLSNWQKMKHIFYRIIKRAKENIEKIWKSK